MSRDAPLSVHDDDDDALPDHLTALLRENSRPGVLLRPPNPVVAISGGTPAPARPVTAIPPVIASAPAGGSSVRVLAPTIPVSTAVPRVQQQVAAAPMPVVAPKSSQHQHRPQPQQQQQQQPTQVQSAPQQQPQQRQHFHHNNQQKPQQQLQQNLQHRQQPPQQQQQQQLPHQHQQAPVQRHQPQAYQRLTQQHQTQQLQAQQHQMQQHQAQKHQAQQHQAQQLPVQPHQAQHHQGQLLHQQIQRSLATQQTVQQQQQPVQQTHQSSDSIVSRSRANKNESPAQTAVWNCVYYNIHMYQQSILSDVHNMIARAYAQIDIGSNIGRSSIVLERLKSAVKSMNMKLVENRSKDPKITYDTSNMSRLIQMQNNLIKEELRGMGVNFIGLKPYMNFDAELKKRADAAYLAVKDRVDRAKRAAAANGGITRPSLNGTADTRTAMDRDTKSAAVAPSPPPSAMPATVTANQVLPAAVSAPVSAANHVQQTHTVSQPTPTPTLQVPAAPRQVTPAAPAPAPPVTPKPAAPVAPAPAYTAGNGTTAAFSAPAAAPAVGGGVAAAPPVAPGPTPILPARVAQPTVASPAHPSAAVPQSLPAVMPAYGAYTAPAPAPVSAPAAIAPAPAAIAPAPAAIAPAPAAIAVTTPAPTPELSSDNLETAKRELESVPAVGSLSQEEGRVRNAPDAAAEGEDSKPWFVTNVVNHRHAWCCLREAAERADMQKVLKGHPWVNPDDPADAGKKAGGCDVLQLMSVAAQFYLKELLQNLKVVAWERKGGLSRELLEGVEARLENPTDSDGEDSPQYELGRGLVPQLPPPGDMPRVLLKEDEERHRQECQDREARWEAELKDKLTAAEELRKRLIRRGQRKLPAGGYKWWEDMDATVKSGWLSREQLATSLFARRVAINHAIGVTATNLKKKEDQANREQSNRAGFEGLNADVSSDAYLNSFTHAPEVPTAEDMAAAASAVPSSIEERKRPFDPLRDNAPLDTVRNIRRRLMLGPAHKNAGVSAISQYMEGFVDEGEKAERTAKMVINNVDLAEMLRSTKPRGGRRAWARVLYHAQIRQRGANGAGAAAVAGALR